jgi:hypothetical protein
MCFVLAGLACLFARSAFNQLSQYLAMATGLIALIALFVYLYDLQAIYSITLYHSMSLQTTVAFLLALSDETDNGNADALPAGH